MSKYNLDFEIPWPTLAQYFDEFLANRIEELSLIKTAFKNQEYKVIDEYAHKWKGCASPYGFGILGQLASELEESLVARDFENCEIIIEEIEIYLNTKKQSHIESY